jgi:two-component system, chemotaxis family, protein-glutamate methylesterase/glutaminase
VLDRTEEGAEPTVACEIVAIASSAGGLKALTAVLSDLPADMPVPIVVVQHLDPRHESLMAELLGRRTLLTVTDAVEGVSLVPGTVYIAPRDRHLQVDAERRVRLTDTSVVRFARPSADVLFASVAAVFGEHAIAVVLTGAGSDGSSGARAIKERGGRVIAQDEATSDFFSMPSSAIETGSVDLVLPLEEIPQALVSLVRGEASV